MSEVNNDAVIKAVFSATPEAKSQALEILQGRAPSFFSDPPDDPMLLSMGDAAKLLNLSRTTLWRCIQAGRLAKIEIYPGAYRLRRSDVLKLVNGADPFESEHDRVGRQRRAIKNEQPEY